jgi:hypothetical protein
MGQPSWDFGRFVKTLSYYGVVPILSSFDWFQSMFESRPNPTVAPAAIASAASQPPMILCVGTVPSAVIQDLSQGGYHLRSLVTPEHPQPGEGDRSAVELIRMDGQDPDQLGQLVGAATAVIYGSSATTVEAIAADPVWQALCRAMADCPPRPEIQAPVFDFGQSNVAVAEIWGPLDDVVMGGVSQSGVRQVGTSAVFAGMVSTANSGGFASIRTRNFSPPLNFSGYDGLRLRLRGDGQRYKFMLRMAETWDSVAYCYSFDTRAEDWMTVSIPFHDLIPVFRAKTVAGAPPLDPHRICALQLMLSKFEYDGALNPAFQPGPFQLELRSVELYGSPPGDRPWILLADLPESVVGSAQVVSPADRERLRIYAPALGQVSSMG